MYIYKIINKINSKVYIGQTIRPIEQRFRRHLNDATHNILDTHFARAIRKYGPENFEISLIDTATSQEELNLKEQQWIRYYNSTIVGYNETDALYKCGGNTYVNKSNEEMESISKKIRDSKLGSKNPHSRMVKCLNIFTMEEIFFRTVDDCRLYFGENTHRFITTRANRQTRSLYQNEWAIAYFENDYSFERNVKKSGIKVSVFNYKTFENSEYSSIRAVCDALHVNRTLFNSESNQILYGDYVITVG